MTNHPVIKAYKDPHLLREAYLISKEASTSTTQRCSAASERAEPAFDVDCMDRLTQVVEANELLAMA